MSLWRWIYRLVEHGRVGDPLIRLGIRQQLRRRLRQLGGGDGAALLDQLRSAPIALHTEAANQQHYELPAELFQLILGKRLKYSCCFWPEGVTTLDAAEAAALALTCERAGIADGMQILELGCGWGSLSLWMAERYPASRIVAVSNSAVQGRFIRAAAKERGIGNLRAVTADMNEFSPRGASGAGSRFDRVVSVEMFEHMRNYRELLARIASWLAPDGRLFVHLFCHRRHPYLFEDRGPSDWLARHFFTGGLMPSADMFRHFEDDLVTERQWLVEGTHYKRTLRTWLANLDRRRERCLQLFEATYGPAEARRWLYRWRLFFLACAELFSFRGGWEWFVAHSLLRPIEGPGPPLHAARSARAGSGNRRSSRMSRSCP